jgi:hypothetical protein
MAEVEVCRLAMLSGLLSPAVSSVSHLPRSAGRFYFVPVQLDEMERIVPADKSNKICPTRTSRIRRR